MAAFSLILIGRDAARLWVDALAAGRRFTFMTQGEVDDLLRSEQAAQRRAAFDALSHIQQNGFDGLGAVAASGLEYVLPVDRIDPVAALNGDAQQEQDGVHFRLQLGDAGLVVGGWWHGLGSGQMVYDRPAYTTAVAS